MIGTRTTVIAPVGPLTWTRLPPKTAASTPATISVIGPAPAPIPELTPNPSASSLSCGAVVPYTQGPMTSQP